MTYESLRANFAWQIPEQFNLGTACADDQPEDNTALISVAIDGTITTRSFGWLADRSSRMAGSLSRLGIGTGDRVAIAAPQSVEVGLTHLAVWKLGAVSLPLASLFGPDAMAYRLADSEAKAVVLHPMNRAKLTEAAHDIIHIETGPEFNEMTSGEPLIEPVSTAAEDPAYLIYTSGTTGSPKGALHAHRSLFGHLPGFELYYEFAPQPDDIIWTPADWAWIGGLMDVLVPAWYHGMTVLTTEADFDAQGAIDLMVDHRVTLAFLPPTALKMMRAAGVGSDALSLRAVFSGGEALGAEMLHWTDDALGCAVNEGYGQTEANLVVGNCASVWPQRPGSMGRSLPGHEVAVFDAGGERVIGELGEICVRSPDPVLMLRYWNRPDDTEAKYRNEWLQTGDLGIEDDDGYLWFRSRKDDVISSMGYRIGPGEIEECLMGHPAVAMCAVVGVRDDIRGQVPAAFVVLRAGHVGSGDLVEDLQERVRTRLAAHEVPRTVTFVSELPRTTTGKIMRRLLRDDPGAG